jgi:PAS domain S-box-containing protein
MDASAPSDIEAASWLFENAVDILLVLDRGRLQAVSPSWRALTGWSDAETLGRSYLEFMHPDERDMVRAHATLMAVAGDASCDHRLLAASGEWLWVRSRTKIATDGRILSVVRDISAETRRAAEQAKAARVAELLGKSAGIYVWRFDPIAQVYDMNPMMEGADPALQVAADVFQAAIHPEDWAQVDLIWRHSLESGAMGETEYRHFFPDLGWRRIRAAWHGISQRPGGMWEILGVSQDITELTDARDAALEAAEVKSRFLANMGHEISTPMNAVLGVLHLVKSDQLSEENQTLVKEALGCGAALAQLLHDIVEFTSLEAEQLELKPEPVDLAHALDGVAAMLRPEAEGRGLSLRVRAPVDAGWARLDPLRLRQILLNLIGNAVKFTLRGSVEVTLSVEGAREDQRVRVEVRDTGVGVPDEAQAKLFQRFQQADGSDTRRFGGLGLGLAVTKALVERMGGRLGFSSVEGAGSTFWAEIAGPACDPPQRDGADAPAWLEGMRILVVEDNPTNRQVATRMLCELGASVDTAENGAEGVRFARSGRYDLILMDIQMPVMDGVSAAREIRALRGPAALTPIVATTANVLSHQIETYRRSGMDGCVAKPISPSALLGEIARLAAG